MIIPATGMPSSAAISLSCEVAWSFLPTRVCSKNQYWNATSAAVTAMMSRYWLSRNTGPSRKPWFSKTGGSTCGCGP